jgi:hypothetical protein
MAALLTEAVEAYAGPFDATKQGNLTMANYFTQFSCVLPLGKAGHVQAALSIYQAFHAEKSAAAEPIGFAAEATPNPYDDPEDGQVWIHADQNGDPEDVLEYVFRCAKALGLTGLWGFRWSLSCSRPTLDGYGGGAHVVDLGTCEIINWIDLDHWLIEQADTYLLKQRAERGVGRPPQALIERRSAALRRYA